MANWTKRFAFAVKSSVGARWADKTSPLSNRADSRVGGTSGVISTEAITDGAECTTGGTLAIGFDAGFEGISATGGALVGREMNENSDSSGDETGESPSLRSLAAVTLTVDTYPEAFEVSSSRRTLEAE